MNKRYLLLLSLLLLSLVGCKDEEADAEGLSTTAILTWAGEPAVDGCGFFVEIEDIQYKPINEEVIPDSYKELAPLSVTLNYESLTSTTAISCGFGGQRMPAIKILEIRKKE